MNKTFFYTLIALAIGLGVTVTKPPLILHSVGALTTFTFGAIALTNALRKRER